MAIDVYCIFECILSEFKSGMTYIVIIIELILNVYPNWN